MPIPAYLWHPIFVHFSVALLTVATVLYVLGALFPRAARRDRWITVAEWTLWIGAGLTVLTLLFGWLAFNTVNHNDASHEAMLVHANWAVVTATGFGLLAVWSIWQRRTRMYPSRPFSVALLVFFGCLVATGLRGGELVFRYGLAVSSLPTPEQEPAPPPLVAPPMQENKSSEHVHHHSPKAHDHPL